MKTEELTKRQQQILVSITAKQEQWIMLSLAFIEKNGTVRPTEVGMYVGRKKEIASAPVSAALKKAVLLDIVQRTSKGEYFKSTFEYTPKYQHEQEFYDKLAQI